MNWRAGDKARSPARDFSRGGGEASRSAAGDKGRIAELWYQQNFVPDGARHVHLKAEEINKGIPNPADQLQKDRFRTSSTRRRSRWWR